ncbi:SET domain-containing protein [Desulfitobacterium metallireducens]|uniref:Lysine methyltransferase n=1 Tax=Desulfitobacterium metallireducens DSM 15288 TaxID=871968 RepID=W0EBE6_9FIRM|nr:SET domain-containing protein [Desulfitobacterium metallireducens]AHF06539.1 lysine methyltransferase [Desulfitobacterium metallireducens DSM 15288]
MQKTTMKTTEKYGRGIFASRNIKKDEFIEEAPVIVLPENEWKLMKKSILSNYVFRWEEHKGLALGYGSLYNHSYTPNARYYTNIENQSIDFYALEDIQENEEITVNYNGDPEDQSLLWFEVIE